MKSADKCFKNVPWNVHKIMQKTVSSLTKDIFFFLSRKKLKTFADDKSNDKTNLNYLFQNQILTLYSIDSHFNAKTTDSF